MPNTTDHGTKERVRAKLECVAGLDRDASAAFGQAIRALLTAMDYEDPALLRSQLNAAGEAVRDSVEDLIPRVVGKSRAMKEACRGARSELTEGPGEDYDDLGRELEALLSRHGDTLAGLRDGLVKALREHGYEVENAAELEREIQELQELKKSLLEGWPWSNRPLPPVNRSMVAQSRAALSRGEGEAVEDLIRRLSGGSVKDG